MQSLGLRGKWSTKLGLGHRQVLQDRMRLTVMGRGRANLTRCDVIPHANGHSFRGNDEDETTTYVPKTVSCHMQQPDGSTVRACPILLTMTLK